MGTVSNRRPQGLVTALHTSLVEHISRRWTKWDCKFHAQCLSGTWSKTHVFPSLSNKSLLCVCAVTVFISVSADWSNRFLICQHLTQFAHSFVLHSMVYLTSRWELQLHGLIPISIFILLHTVHQQGCPGRYCCLF